MPSELSDKLNTLADLLEERLKVIADTEWRDRDPEGQLGRLQEVGTQVFEMHHQVRGQIPPRLEHFLSGCSYDKALAFIREL